MIKTLLLILGIFIVGIVAGIFLTIYVLVKGFEEMIQVRPKQFKNEDD